MSEQEIDSKRLLSELTTLRKRIKELEVVETECNSTKLYLDILGHDINNLNQAIISYNELLMVRPDISDESKKYIKKSLSQARAIADLISIVKTYSNMPNQEFDLENINITKLFDQLFSDMELKYQDRNIEFNHIMDSGKIFVRSSKLLYNVIENIFDYIIKFDPYETVSIDIAHKLTEDKKYWKFEFLNSTSYIHKFDFNESSRNEKSDGLKNTDQSEGSQGFGLGLIIVHEIISRCGGRVWIEDTGESSPHRGNRFIIMLPKGELP
jgi:light-regulated signal transduction histidine kinase (bacteriophytochrome)